MPGYFNANTTQSIAATGSSQSTAALITGTMNTITAADGTKAVRLPVPQGGEDIRPVLIFNSDASNSLPVYPQSGATIDAGSADAALTMAAGEFTVFYPISLTSWRTRQLVPSALSATAGTVTASKAVIVDANKDAASFRNVTVTNLDAGASGTAGTVDIFPTTASKGKIQIAAADQTGNTTLTITNATMGQATTLTIPDGGSSTDTIATLKAANAFTARLTTTDGVGSGTARVIGGRAYENVAASDNLLASAGASAHVDFANTYSIPANTIGASTRVKIKALVRVTDASGSDTLEVKLYLGGTTLVTTTAVDPSSSSDYVMIEFEIVSRAAAGAAASLVGCGKWWSKVGSTEATGTAILAPTNHATNGALVVKVSAKWSSTTANTNANLAILGVEII